MVCTTISPPLSNFICHYLVDAQVQSLEKSGRLTDVGFFVAALGLVFLLIYRPYWDWYWLRHVHLFHTKSRLQKPHALYP
jgi:hypothetical protein